MFRVSLAAVVIWTAIPIGGCTTRPDREAPPGSIRTVRRWSPHRHRYVTRQVEVIEGAGSDRDEDGVIGFTDLQNSSRPSVMRSPQQDPQDAFDRHMERQSPNWKREHRDELPR